MTSTVTNYSNSINTNYPVPGVDNDTQGFRDIFSNVKNALNVAAGEIGSLQLNAVVANESNDFAYGGTLYRSILRSPVVHVNDLGAVTVDTPISIEDGSYQTVNVTGTVNFDVDNWGGADVDGNAGSIILEIYNGSGSTANVNFSNSIGTTLKKDVSLPITVASSGTVFVELWSTNNGESVYLRQIGGNFV